MTFPLAHISPDYSYKMDIDDAFNEWYGKKLPPVPLLKRLYEILNSRFVHREKLKIQEFIYLGYDIRNNVPYQDSPYADYKGRVYIMIYISSPGYHHLLYIPSFALKSIDSLLVHLRDLIRSQNLKDLYEPIMRA